MFMQRSKTFTNIGEQTRQKYPNTAQWNHTLELDNPNDPHSKVMSDNMRSSMVKPTARCEIDLDLTKTKAKDTDQHKKKPHMLASIIRSWTTNSMAVKRSSKIVPEEINEFSEIISHNESTHLGLNTKTYDTDIEELRTPQLATSESFGSLTDENLTPLTSAFPTQLAVSEAPVPSITQSIALTKESSAVISLGDTKPLHRSITNVFSHWGKSLKKAFKKKKTQLKSTFSSISIATKPKTPSGDNFIRRPSGVSQASTLSDDTIDTSQGDSLTSLEQFMPTQNYMTTIHQDGDKSDSEEDNNSLDTPPAIRYTDVSDLASTRTKINYSMSFEFEDLFDLDSNLHYDKLYEEIRKRSIEYQEYFAAAESNELASKEVEFFDDEHCFATPTQTLHDRFGFMSPATKKKPSVMPTSKTEGFMVGLNDSVPYVCVGKGSTHAEGSSSKRATKVFQIDDIKTYTRSTSVFSNIKDYDLQWQNHFHEDQQDRDKLELTLRCITWDLFEQVKRNHQNRTFQVNGLFDESREEENDVSEYVPEIEPLTDATDIYEQLAYVFDCGNFNSEHAILTYIYINRVIKYSNQSIWDFTWRLFMLIGLLTAIKTWDDCAVFNADFISIFPELEIGKINKIEKKFLELLNWDVTVRCSEFAETYFHLRSLERYAKDF